MARVAISVSVFLFLLTLSRARDLPNPFAESEPASEQIHEPETTTRPQSSKPQQHDTVSLTLDSVDPVPLTFLNFRPINRHVLPLRSLPLSHRRCHHGPRREIPYGNDMIVLSDAASKNPVRWERFHKVEPRFPQMFPGMMAQPHHFHHGRNHHHHQHHHEKGWFAKRISELMNLF